MENSSFDSLEQVAPQQDASALLNQLVKQVEEQKDYHKLFDAKMLQKKQELGLPLSRPSSLQDVPDEHRKEVEATYVEAAREVGEKFIEQGDLASAWMYLQVIREPKKLAAALEELPDQIEDYERMEEILQLAMYQGVNRQRTAEPAGGHHADLAGAEAGRQNQVHGQCTRILLITDRAKHHMLER